MTRALRDQTAIIWLLAAIAIAIWRKWVPDSAWLMVHLVLLGALSHSVMVWSEHFAKTLLRVPLSQCATGRYGMLALGSLAVLVSMPANFWAGVVTGATLIAGAVIWHLSAILQALRRALPTRFRKVTYYYLASSIFLPIGASFGAALAYGLSDTWHARSLAAHIILNVFGWIGLTVIGTLVTFWPTLLRARMDDRAEKLAAHALPIFIVAIAVGVTGALTGARWVILGGLLIYIVGLIWVGRSMILPIKKRGITEFAPASVGAALLWALVGMCFMVVRLAMSWESFTDTIFTTAGIFALGFGVQILLGALTHLFPMAIGGGPAGSRAALTELTRLSTWRLTVTNLGLVLLLLPLPKWMWVGVAVVTIAAVAAFLPLLFRALFAALRIKHAQQNESAPANATQAEDSAAASAQVAAPTAAKPGIERTLVRPGQFVAAVLTLTVALTVGVTLQPATFVLTLNHMFTATGDSANAVSPTGETTEVTVTAADMRFTPSSIDVPAGNRLVITVVNEDEVSSHDLVVADRRTKRLLPGESEVLDAGIITTSIEGWCSIAGHRQMGMVIQINAIGGSEASSASAQKNGGHNHGSAHIMPDLDQQLHQVIDPKLPQRTDATVHKLNIDVTELPLEVAPGIWQKRWTFNGKSVAPTLRGRVGDTFEITLTNNGTMGHSIDFHAGALAPDEPMRTIPPGESLVYTFKAERAGIWLYHCATHPMASHIAAGMHGAVIIEPDHLEPVENEFVFVQSEIYLGDQYDSPETAQEVNADKVLAESPDLMAFNGIADQYVQNPIEVPVGERVRIWLMDAGPTRAFPFHIVGTQFDTTWTEGAYTLKAGRDAFGYPQGGAQVLPLLAAQGGFVELVFPEAGTYTAVNHAMIDGEKGARAIFKAVEK
ncbi:MAG: multicopper oxidase domain-containing protein [Trueperella sp.]|nr:multicopper oxidase domain-containing protein [Trueperella sp.]